MMQNYSIFSILGPVMIGPSSSHTAGAERIGRAMHLALEGDIRSVRFLLHGSFASTYRGHGTDKALVAGILGLEPNDERIRESFELAAQKGLSFSFEEADLGDVHPNTVKIIATRADGSAYSMMGSSIGGGNILITELGGIACEFTGGYPVLVVSHLDKVGMISRITHVIAVNQNNIVSIRHYRRGKGEEANTIIEVDSPIDEQTISGIRVIDHVLQVQSIGRLDT